MSLFKRHPQQESMTLPNGTYVVVTDCGKPDAARRARGQHRYEVEHGRGRAVTLRYLPTRRKVRAFLRDLGRL